MISKSARLRRRHERLGCKMMVEQRKGAKLRHLSKQFLVITIAQSDVKTRARDERGKFLNPLIKMRERLLKLLRRSYTSEREFQPAVAA